MERKAWHCPACGKVHAPHVDTCPDVLVAVTVPSIWPMPDYPYRSATAATRMPWETQWVSDTTGYSTQAFRDITLADVGRNN